MVLLLMTLAIVGFFLGGIIMLRSHSAGDRASRCGVGKGRLKVAKKINSRGEVG